MIVDVHAHYIPASVLDALCANRRMFPSVAVLGERNAVRFAFAGQEPTRPVMPKLSDMAQRKEWLTKQRIDRQVVGSWLDIFGYELPAEEGADWCRFLNEHMRAAASEVSAFVPLAYVPLQNGKLAAGILAEAMASGFHGAMIGTQPKGMGGNLDDAELDPFWETASSLKAAIFLHPMFVCGDDRLSQYDLVNGVGRLTDTTIAVSRLLFSGHLTRYPGMNLVLSHGGAALPFALGRIRRNYDNHRDYAEPLAEFRRLYFDTVLFDPRALRFLCDVAGADKVLLGSDHPFPIGDPEPVRIVDDTPLTPAERQAIWARPPPGCFIFPAIAAPRDDQNPVAGLTISVDRMSIRYNISLTSAAVFSYAGVLNGQRAFQADMDIRGKAWARPGASSRVRGPRESRRAACRGHSFPIGRGNECRARRRAHSALSRAFAGTKRGFPSLPRAPFPARAEPAQGGGRGLSGGSNA
jgi:aminocarboxymuconate-semialdehyde decarboxylase